MTVSRDRQLLKEFRAVDPVSRVMASRFFSRGLGGEHEAVPQSGAGGHAPPGPVRPDRRGSEFMAEFEAECEAGELPLFVLPPPPVERAGGALQRHAALGVLGPLWPEDLTVSAVFWALAEDQRCHNAQRS